MSNPWRVSLYYSSTVEATTILPMFPAYFIFNSLLVLLLVLHIAWTYLILLIVRSSLKSGQVSNYCSVCGFPICPSCYAMRCYDCVDLIVPV